MTGHTESLRERKLAYLAIGVVLLVLVWFLPVPRLPLAGVHTLSLLVLASVLWLGGVKSFVECAKHSIYLFPPKLLILVLIALSWMVALRLL